MTADLFDNIIKRLKKSDKKTRFVTIANMPDEDLVDLVLYIFNNYEIKKHGKSKT